MKKTKKLILLYFLHQQQGAKKMQQSFSYEEVYVALPIAESTIRGILNEFEGERLIRKTVSQTTLLWQLTQTGIRTAESIFGRLSHDTSSHSLHLIHVHASSRELSDFQRIQLDTHTFAIFGEEERALNRRYPRSLVLPQSAASEKVIVQEWLESLAGRRIIRDREQISRQIDVLFPQRKNDRVIAPRVRTRQQKLLCSIISAIEDLSQSPEIYYPQSLRVNELLRRIW